MKQFFKFLFASCLGTMLALFLIVGLVFWRSMVMVKKANAAAKVKPNTVLKITLGDPIPEKANNMAVSGADFNLEGTAGLYDYTRALELAKEDDKIKGIYMELNPGAIGMATMSKIRESIADFKESGKFVISYGNYYSQSGYYMASVGDKVYLNPAGGIEFGGFSAQIPFFKKFIDRMGIKAQVYYAGKFKSATEPFRREDMSPENRLQVREYLEDNYQFFLKGIAESRSIPVGSLRKMADNLEIQFPTDALDKKLVDGLKYKDQLLDELRDRIGLDEKDDINTMSIKSYFKSAKKPSNFRAKNKIAVVFAEGNIVDGKGETGNIGGDRYSKIIRDIRNDDKVKAIVMRVNSGGGSALASELIWREIEEAKAQGIKVVATMGDVAASGGYYIACNADKIYAEPNTITGSIGVFGMLPGVGEFMKEEVGITFDTIKTGKFSTLGSPFFDVTDTEGAIIQRSIDSVYLQFLTRVSNGRDMALPDVKEVAQGRVWAGTKALSIKLVDELGGLDDAINTAAELADLDDYKISQYPKTKEPLQQLIDSFTGKKSVQSMIKSEMGEEYYQYYLQAKEIKNMSGIQARMPFQIIIH